MNKNDFIVSAIKYSAIKGQINLFQDKLIEHQAEMQAYLKSVDPHDFKDYDLDEEVENLIKRIWGGDWSSSKPRQDSSLSQK